MAEVGRSGSEVHSDELLYVDDVKLHDGEMFCVGAEAQSVDMVEHVTKEAEVQVLLGFAPVAAPVVEQVQSDDLIYVQPFEADSVSKGVETAGATELTECMTIPSGRYRIGWQGHSRHGVSATSRHGASKVILCR